MTGGGLFEESRKRTAQLKPTDLVSEAWNSDLAKHPQIVRPRPEELAGCRMAYIE